MVGFIWFLGNMFQGALNCLLSLERLGTARVRATRKNAQSNVEGTRNHNFTLGLNAAGNSRYQRSVTGGLVADFEEDHCAYQIGRSHSTRSTATL